MKTLKLFGLVCVVSSLSLAQAGDGVVSASNLIHRWSFASNAVDSVGGTTGTLYGTAAVSGGQLVLKGGSQGSSYANLGTGLLPTSGAFTIELWAKKTAVSAHARIFDIGTGNNNYIFMSWNYATSANTDQIGYLYKINANYEKHTDNSMQYALNTFYHIAISYAPQSDNSTVITWSRRNLNTGVLERSGTMTSHTGWTPSLLTAQAVFWLGHSHWSEPDSASVYEEIRVWNTALTADQIAWSARLGPDVLPTTAMDDATATGTLTATSDEQGTVAVNGGIASTSTNAVDLLSTFSTNTLTATAVTGYRFKTWTGDTYAIVEGSASTPTIKVLSARAVSLNATYQLAVSTWSGLAGDGLWTSENNWADFVPTDGSEIVFGASSSTATENNQIGTAGLITFQSDAPAYTIAGNALNLPKLVNNSTATQTFNCAVTSASGLTLTNAGTVKFGEVFSGTGIVASGAGKVVLANGFASGANTAFTLTGQSAEIGGSSTGYGLYLSGAGAAATMPAGSTFTATVDDNSGIDIGKEGSGSPSLVLNGATVNTGHFIAGRSSTATGTITQNGGTVTASRWFVAGINGTGVYNLKAGMYKGTWVAEGNPPFIVAENSGSKGTVNITGASTLSTAGSIDIGKRGTGTVNQSGGTFTVGKDVFFAREATGTGTYNLTGGKVSATSGWTYVGYKGTGALNISGTGVLSTGWVAFNAASSDNLSSVNVKDGGTLEATKFRSHYRFGRSELTVDGGTIKARGSNQYYTTFFDGLSKIEVGTGGMTFDTGDNSIAFNEAVLTKSSTGTITKKGTGTLYLPTASAPNGGLKVSEGTVVATSPIPLTTTAGTKAATVPHLIHRWRFNDGSLTDEVTGNTATTNGTVSFVNGCLRLPGGANGTGYVDLGANLVPTDGRPFTIEIFATPKSIQSWSRIFSFGPNTDATKNGVTMTWSRGTEANTDYTVVKSGGVVKQDWSNGLGGYAAGTAYHITFVCRPNACGNNKMAVGAARETLSGGQSFTGTADAVDASASILASGHFWLGHSPYTADYDANADYDEVRIWDVALTPEQSRRNAVLGAETLPNFDGGLVHRWSFNGDYTDSVGGQTATACGAQAAQIAWDDESNPKAVKLPGVGSNTAWISLGQGAVPCSGDAVTIELWATKLSEKGWARLIELGSGTSQNYLYMCHQSGGGRVEFKANNTIEVQTDNTMTYTVGTRYHVAMTIVRNANGTTTFKWSSRNDSGTVQKSGTATTKNVVTLDPLFFANSTLNLGHTAYTTWKDPDANTSYDEVRIWRGALSDAQLVANAQLGPDTLPTTVDYAETAGDASAVANIDLGADGTFQWQSDLSVETVTGTGTLAGTGTLTVTKALDVAGEETGELTLNGALAVTGTWTIDAAAAAACDRLVGTGSVDLSQAKLEIRDPATMTAHRYEIVNGPAVTGALPESPAPSYALRAEPNRLVLVRRELIIIIR